MAPDEDAAPLTVEQRIEAAIARIRADPNYDDEFRAQLIATLEEGRFCEVCGEEPVLGVASCMLAQPVSVGYGRDCLANGIEAFHVVMGTLYGCWEILEKPVEEQLAPWAFEIVDRSLRFHQARGKIPADVDVWDWARGHVAIVQTEIEEAEREYMEHERDG